MSRAVGFKHSEDTKRKMRSSQSGERGNNWKGGLLSRLCATCGKEFSFKRNRADTARFCSYRCRRLLVNVRGLERPQTRGERNGNWRGGVTLGRKVFNTSMGWRMLCREVYLRDNLTCQRCLTKFNHDGEGFHCHHIIPFGNKETRLDINNIVLLCKTCHNFVHSRLNTGREFL